MKERKDFINACERILWLEKEMMQGYQAYKKFFRDEKITGVFEGLAKDEARHINMAERILVILRQATDRP